MPKKLNKTYFGTPKTPIDDNTIFYASFDGTTKSEIGDNLGVTSSFLPSVTGYGLTQTMSNWMSNTIDLPKGDFTIDAWVDLTGGSKDILTLCQNNDELSEVQKRSLVVYYTENFSFKITHFFKNSSTQVETYNIPNSMNIGLSHIRLVFSSGISRAHLYLNGRKVYTFTNDIVNPLDKFYLGKGLLTATQNPLLISDLSISNIDRGDHFPTLPQDFIDGNATVVPAFTSQRHVYADPLTSQVTTEIVKASGYNAKQITVTQATPNVWVSGDTIKVKGMTGEVISGVIDTDTALATIMVDAKVGASALYVDNISKLAVNDTFKTFNSNNGYLGLPNYTISSIDIVNKTITFLPTLQENLWGNFCNIFETTPSTSSPLVKYMNGTVLTNVEGTWSNLGTNEATFTLGTNATLTNKDIQIDYSLNIIPGQGQVPVYDEVLGGEIKGKKLVVNPTVHITDDFKEKITGSTLECPHIVKNRYASNLGVISDYVAEIIQPRYDSIKALDGNSYTPVTLTSGQLTSVLFSFNLIELVERKYGEIKALDKVQWLKDNLSKIICNWYGYGTCPSGNKAYFRHWRGDAWNDSYAGSNTSNSASVIKLNPPVSLSVDSNGFSHYLAYTEASDGVTSSTIYTDYINVEVTLKTPTGYDVLAPEDTFSRTGWKVKSEDLKEVSDFKNKVYWRVAENPHISKYTNISSNLLSPSGTWTDEIGTESYYNLSNNDKLYENCPSISVSSIPQQLFSFNLIELVERRYGEIKSLDKVQWVKENISRVICNWNGYGSCPSGNKAYFKVWNVMRTLWDTYILSNTSSSPSNISYDVGSGPYSYIDDNGFTHFIAYTDAYDGVTGTSVTTNYINIEVTLKDNAVKSLGYFKNKYKTSNILLVRKATKEVQSYFDASNEDGVVVYGKYLPYQGVGKNKVTLLTSPEHGFATTKGTGGLAETSNKIEVLPNTITRLPLGRSLSDYNFIGELIEISGDNYQYAFPKLLSMNQSDPSNPYRFKYGIGSQLTFDFSSQATRGLDHAGITIHHSFENITSSKNSSVLYTMYYLALTSENKLVLIVMTSTNRKMLVNGSDNCAIDTFELKNKPLIK